VLLRRPYRLPLEMAVVAVVLLLWQVIRIPLEGSTDVALAHARDWLDVERSLHVDVEQSLVDLATGHGHALHPGASQMAYGWTAGSRRGAAERDCSRREHALRLSRLRRGDGALAGVALPVGVADAALPPLVFLVIVGTGNHYVLDAVLGSVCVAFGVVAARLLHGPLRARGRPASTRTVVGAAVLYGVAGLVVNALLTGEWT
jgi:hypothetical protein